jgi:hypothetical protein
MVSTRLGADYVAPSKKENFANERRDRPCFLPAPNSGYVNAEQSDLQKHACVIAN